MYVCRIVHKQFKIAYSPLLAFAYSTAVCNGAEISIKEAHGTDNDGIVTHGSDYTIECSVAGMRPGFVAVW